MESSVQSLKSFIDIRRGEIAARHRSEGGGFPTAVALSQMMDEAVRMAFSSLTPDVAGELAVLALGGYGRVELFPKSDIDIMVLAPKGVDTHAAGGAAKQLLHLLWDTGLDVGHSVRTIGDAMALHGNTIDSWASMMESRFVCGNEPLAKEFYRRLFERSSSDRDAWFIRQVFADIRDRHEQYGNSVKLLEPNVKNSAGGLRDVQALYWLYRSADPAFRIAFGAGQPALPQFLGLLREAEVLDAESHREALKALEFLFRVRQEMHYLRESIQDTLGFSLQISVAEALDYGSKADLRSVEVFMREYFRHARVLFRLSDRLRQRFREVIEPPRRGLPFTRKKVADRFYIRDNVLSLDFPLRQFADPTRVYQTFTLAAQHGAALDFRLRGTIAHSLNLITEKERSSVGLSAMFRNILASERVTETLRDMNDLGVLSCFLPEWADLVAFFQHDDYHYYTADEHTIIAVGNAENLRNDSSFLHDIHAALTRKDILYLALLLHDIAKPRGIAEHEVTGVDMARGILSRLDLEDMFPDVAFLVRHHLVMERLAFRRNVHDPGTIREFAEKFPRPELLDYLFVLTYADLSAVRAGVWTEWKSELLRELYLRTAEVLSRDLRGAEVEDFHRSRHREAVGNLVETLSAGLPREDVERHLQGIQNAAYLALFSEKEIGQHLLSSAQAESVSASFSHGKGFTDVTVIARDAPFALSKFCAVLAANDANIFDASIFTRDDGVIIDRFRVTDAATGDRLEQRICDKISADLTTVMEGSLDVDHLFAEHKRKWKRRTKRPSPQNGRVEVLFEANPQYTIIDVYGPDTVGALYRITETLSRLGLDIHFAKIATRVDGILDAFYTLDRSGRPLGKNLQPGIREEIMKLLVSLSEEELA